MILNILLSITFFVIGVILGGWLQTPSQGYMPEYTGADCDPSRSE